MGGLFGGKPKAPKPPPRVEPPKIKAPAALPDNKLLKDSRKQQAAAARKRGGRVSTILSGENETLG